MCHSVTQTAERVNFTSWLPRSQKDLPNQSLWTGSLQTSWEADTAQRVITRLLMPFHSALWFFSCAA